MSKNRTLYLHIGSHKTGTTALQQFLYSRSAELENNGYETFVKLPNGKTSKSKNANKWVDFSGQYETFRATVNPAIYDELARGNLNTILSSEELFWLNDANEISNLYASLKSVYTKIVVICYVRRQDKQLLSHYQQGFKFPYSSVFRFYGADSCIIPQHKDYYTKYLNYAKKLRVWEDIVGFDNLKVREYDKKALKNNDIVTDFIHLLPFSLTPHENPKYRNESLNISQAIINFYVFKTREKLWYELGREAFTKNITFVKYKKPALTSNSSMQLLSLYRHSNIELKRFVPTLTDDWDINELNNNQTALENKNLPFSTEDYESALVFILKYYDELSMIDVIRIKLKKQLNNLVFVKKIRKVLFNK